MSRRNRIGGYYTSGSRDMSPIGCLGMFLMIPAAAIVFGIICWAISNDQVIK